MTENKALIIGLGLIAVGITAYFLLKKPEEVSARIDNFTITA